MKHWRYEVRRGIGANVTGYVAASAHHVAVSRVVGRFTWHAQDVIRLELHPVKPAEFNAVKRREHRADVDRPGGRCGYLLNDRPCPFGCVPFGPVGRPQG